MKKTLAALALATASAMSAYAAADYSYVNHDGATNDPIADGGTKSGTFYSGSSTDTALTMIAVVDVYKLATDTDLSSDVQGLAHLSQGDQYYRGFSAHVDSDGFLVLSASSTNNSVCRAYTTDVKIADTATYSQGDIIALALTIHNNGNSVSVGNFYIYEGSTLTGIKTKADGTEDTTYASIYLSQASFNKLTFGAELGNDLSSLTVYKSYMEGEELTRAVSAAYNAAIPEPATATLSLLALAGLCARRRRK